MVHDEKQASVEVLWNGRGQWCMMKNKQMWKFCEMGEANGAWNTSKCGSSVKWERPMVHEKQANVEVLWNGRGQWCMMKNKQVWKFCKIGEANGAWWKTSKCGSSAKWERPMVHEIQASVEVLWNGRGQWCMMKNKQVWKFCEMGEANGAWWKASKCGSSVKWERPMVHDEKQASVEVLWNGRGQWCMMKSKQVWKFCEMGEANGAWWKASKCGSSVKWERPTVREKQASVEVEWNERGHWCVKNKQVKWERPKVHDEKQISVEEYWLTSFRIISNIPVSPDETCGRAKTKNYTIHVTHNDRNNKVWKDCR